ncbi:serglycin [Paralichthys olivaceus]|uniref:serglycin n=1 Tax=Paralichthys olivaceus TaxID=8255 RepID=UPI00097D2E83|nr:PREDICTED: uncharacterized protein LOC109636723 [Paralichthys olivaceus]
MKVILLLIVSCLALHNGKGAPTTAVYKFVRCNPDGDRANCVTQQTAKMAWSADLPAKLPPSAAQYLESEPVEDEHPPQEEEEDDIPVNSEEGESPQPEEGSGGYEGSASEWPSFIADRLPYESETGSGESWTKGDMDMYKGEDERLMSRSVADDAKPAEQELRDDHFLQL